MTVRRWFGAGALLACLTLASPLHAYPETQPDAEGGPPPPLGFSLAQGWLDPWPHSHFSRAGAPRVHPFGIEPAFLGRDLIVDYGFQHGDEGVEHELEAELEWALTRRLGLIAEAPLLMLNPDEGESERGLGDVGLGVRLLLAETERMLISANVGAALPTGDEERALGSGEVSLEPSLALWLDAGSGLTVSAQLGTGHALESGQDLLEYGVGLAYSVQGPALIRGHASHAEHGHAHGQVHSGSPHFPPGFTTILAELTGSVVLDGQDDGEAAWQALAGVSYCVNDRLELRAAFQTSLGQPREFDRALIVGLIFHF